MRRDGWGEIPDSPGCNGEVGLRKHLADLGCTAKVETDVVGGEWRLDGQVDTVGK